MRLKVLNKMFAYAALHRVNADFDLTFIKESFLHLLKKYKGIV